MPPLPVTGTCDIPKPTATPNPVNCWVAVTAGLTVWVNGDDVLVAKFASPLKTATTAWAPADNTTVQVAEPLETAAAPQPEMVLPSLLNATVASLTVVLLVTVAVNISDWGEVAGLTDELTVVVVAACANAWCGANSEIKSTAGEIHAAARRPADPWPQNTQ